MLGDPISSIVHLLVKKTHAMSTTTFHSDIMLMKKKRMLTASTMPFSSFISVISGYPGRMGLSSRDDKSFDDDDEAAAFILSSSK